MANTNDIRAGGAYVEVRADTSKVANDIDKGVLHHLKRGLGGRSELKDVLELLKPTAGFAAIAVAGEVFKGIAEGFTKIREASLDVNKNWADVAQAGMRSLPMFGALAGAGEAINEAMTGQQEEARKATEEANRLNEALERRVAILKAGDDAARGLNTTLRGLQDKGERVGEGAAPSAIQSKQDLRNALAGIAEDRRKGLEDVNKSGEVEVTDATGAKRKVPVMDPTARKQLETQAAQLDAQINEKRAKAVEPVGPIGVGSVYQIAQNDQIVRGTDPELLAMEKRRNEIRAQLNNAKVGDTAVKTATDKVNNAADAAGKQAIANYLSERLNALVDGGIAAYGAEAKREGEAFRKREARRLGQQDVENDIANQRQAVIDSIKKPGEKIADQRQYLESIGVSGSALEQAMQEFQKSLGGGVSRGQFGAAGAEMMGNGGMQERIAKATEETAKGIKKITGSGWNLRFS